jgi:nitrite reductase (NADH) small subunit
MGERRAASVGDIREGGRIIVTLDGESVAIFLLKGQYFALRNSCVHQGGPACEGLMLPAHRALVLNGGEVREYLDHDNPVVVCPWHGWEYDVKTGRCLADPSRGLRSYTVRLNNGAIMIV